MYLNFYGLKKKPFSLIPDPYFIHFSEQHKIAYSILQYAVAEHIGLSVITGEIGSGKTTLVRHLLNQLDHNNIIVGAFDAADESWGSLPSRMTSALNIDTLNQEDKANLYKLLTTFIKKMHVEGKRVLLIIDEAQNLSVPDLEELRLLMNINSGSEISLQMLLIGQPEFMETLRLPCLLQLAQRVSVAYHLGALSAQDTKQYVLHRLQAAECERALFDESALECIHQYSAGIPRIINSICDSSLVYGYGVGEEIIDADAVLVAAKNNVLNPKNYFTAPMGEPC